LETLPLTEQDWQQLDASHVWREVVLPYLQFLERETLDHLQQSSGTPEIVNNLAGRLQTIAAIRDAPARHLALMRRPQPEPTLETDDGRRRETVFGRFRRSLRG